MKLIIFVHTCKSYENNRAKVIERSWVANRDDVVFITDNPSSELKRHIYVGEYEKGYTYHPETVKKMFVLFLEKYPDYDFYMTIDDDSYLYVDKLRTFLSFFDTGGSYMIGDFLNWPNIHPSFAPEGDYKNWIGGGAGIVYTKSCIRKYVDLYNKFDLPYENSDVWLHKLFELSDKTIRRVHCPGFHQYGPGPNIYNGDYFLNPSSREDNSVISIHLNGKVSLLKDYHKLTYPDWTMTDDISIDEYFAKYDTLKKTFVFNFDIEFGGVGDVTRGILYLIEVCKKHDVRFYFNTNSTIFNYLHTRYHKLFIPFHEALAISEPIVINKISDIPRIEPNKFYLGRYSIVYQDFCDNSLYDRLKYNLSDIFYFSDQVITNANKFIKSDDKYISIHLRLGDKYLETDKNFIRCPNDQRAFDENALFSLIEENAHKTIYFFCDNNAYKQTLKNKYNFINIITYEIGHTCALNTTPEQILNTLTDFYLLSKSEHIYSMAWSVFPVMAAKYNGTPITKYKLYNPDAYVL